MAKGQDKHLRAPVQDYFTAYKKAAATSDDEARQILRSEAGFSYFQGGIVELSEDVVERQAKLVEAVTKRLGAKAGNERAVEELVQRRVQAWLISNSAIEHSIDELVKTIDEIKQNECGFFAPNFLVRFQEPVRSVQIGRVRAALTEEIAKEITSHNLGKPLQVKIARDFKALPGEGIEMPAFCWMVDVNAVRENAREEAKWLIDVAVCLLRLHYDRRLAPYPHEGDVEPHPYYRPTFQSVGVMLQNGGVFGGGRATPRGYMIDDKIHQITQSSDFCGKANLIFDPPGKSLAERVHQGLGWLTRGRQAEDRAERLLFFFTAIEALLSSSDHNNPVTQTIARHAGALWTDDVGERLILATEIKKLYGLRSKVVHSGNRAILWNSANLTQYIAEGLFWNALRWANLGVPYQSFFDQLAKAGDSMPWLPRLDATPKV